MTENPLYQAVRYLSGNCDGAFSRDGAGFNRFDSPVGKQLASMSWEIWSQKQKHQVWRMLSKYRKQLGQAGIDYDSIPIPIGGNGKATGGVRLKGNLIEIWFNYRADLVTQVKEIPGRRWDPQTKLWTVPVNHTTAAQCAAFARKHDFDIDDDVLALTDPDAVMAEPITPIQDYTPIGRTISLEEYWVAVRFDYNERVVESIKGLQIAKWDKETKTWRVPYDADSLKKLWDWAPTYGFKGDFGGLEEKIRELLELREKAIEASQAKDADIEIEGLGGELRPFQKAGVKYAIEKQRLIIADEMGLGKTIEALATVHALDTFPLLIVCPASLKLNWYREAKKWLPGRTFHMLGGNGFGRSGADITIVNYDRLNDYKEYLIKCGFRAIIGDESHRLKSATAIRTLAFEEISMGCLYGRKGPRMQKADRRNKTNLGQEIPVRLLLTGTPLPNRPTEAIQQLVIIGRLQEFGGWWKFMQRYGYGLHLTELNEMLRAKCLVRRLKSEVLTELPPKVRTVIPIEISNRDEYNRAHANLIGWLRETQGAEKAEKARRAEQLVRIGALKQLAARGKMAAAKAWVDDFLEDSDEKLLVFGWHKEIVREMARRFNCREITGDTSLANRDSYVSEFQEDDAHRLMACNILAGGEGLNLTAASNVAFLELGWNDAQMDQALSRCHRIGQVKSVTGWWLVGRNTIDEPIAELIAEKKLEVDAAVDGIDPEQGSQGILDALIDRLVKPQVLELTGE